MWNAWGKLIYIRDGQILVSHCKKVWNLFCGCWAYSKWLTSRWMTSIFWYLLREWIACSEVRNKDLITSCVMSGGSLWSITPTLWERLWDPKVNLWYFVQNLSKKYSFWLIPSFPIWWLGEDMMIFVKTGDIRRGSVFMEHNLEVKITL